MDGFDLGTLFATLALDDTLTPGLQQAGQGLSTFGGQAATAGLALTASITAPLALLGATSLSAAMDFESSSSPKGCVRWPGNPDQRQRVESDRGSGGARGSLAGLRARRNHQRSWGRLRVCVKALRETPMKTER